MKDSELIEIAEAIRIPLSEAIRFLAYRLEPEGDGLGLIADAIGANLGTAITEAGNNIAEAIVDAAKIIAESR